MDPKNWTLVSDAVGCGIGRYRCRSLVIWLTPLPANDAAQVECMKQVPYKTLLDTVISTGTSFLLLIDSWSSYALCIYES
jgi:hypothetical protein